LGAVGWLVAGRESRAGKLAAVGSAGGVGSLRVVVDSTRHAPPDMTFQAVGERANMGERRVRRHFDSERALHNARPAWSSVGRPPIRMGS
jgi:hypothetical protein